MFFITCKHCCAMSPHFCSPSKIHSFVLLFTWLRFPTIFSRAPFSSRGLLFVAVISRRGRPRDSGGSECSQRVEAASAASQCRQPEQRGSAASQCSQYSQPVQATSVDR